MELVKEPLLSSPKKAPRKYITPEMTPLDRYNLVVDCYN